MIAAILVCDYRGTRSNHFTNSYHKNKYLYSSILSPKIIIKTKDKKFIKKYI